MLWGIFCNDSKGLKRQAPPNDHVDGYSKPSIFLSNYLSDALQRHPFAVESRYGFRLPAPVWTSTGKELSLKEEEDLTCYLEYGNSDRQEHRVRQYNEKEKS